MNSLGHDSFRIELIENYPCESKAELLRREGIIIRELEPTLNANVAGRTVQEYRQEKAELIAMLNKKWKKEHDEAVKKYMKEYCKTYYTQHKDDLMCSFKEYYENNKDKLLNYHKEYREKNAETIKEKRKDFYDMNKQTILEKQKEYRARNRDTILAKMKEKITCHICSSTYNVHNRLRHERTKKHLHALEQQS
jgi:hypothetical protein